MDIQKIITDLLAKIQGDDKLIASFKKDPVAAVTKLVSNLGITQDQIKTIADAISAKLGIDDVKNVLGGLGSLFGK